MPVNLEIAEMVFSFKIFCAGFQTFSTFSAKDVVLYQRAEELNDFLLKGMYV